MPQISQNADGTYGKTHSDIEIFLVRQIQQEILDRKAGDQDLLTQIISLGNRTTALEGYEFSLADMQKAIDQNKLSLQDHETRITTLEHTVTVDPYSKAEVDSYLVSWKVEEIAQPFDIPTSQMFDLASMNEIKSGFVHYKHGDINEPQGFQIAPNTMRRYTIWAFAASPKKVDFNIFYADKCVVLLNGATQATYQDDGGNFATTAKALTLDLDTGWSKIQFLIANDTQEGGLVVTSNLYEMADSLTSMDFISGAITGDQIALGSLTAEHFSPNMDLVLRALRVTAASEPGVIIGNPDDGGILQIGDGTIKKTKDEAFQFDGDIQLGVGKHIYNSDGLEIDGGGNGLSAIDRQKLDSIDWNAQKNQNAFSFVKVSGIADPSNGADPFFNVISSQSSTDTLTISGDNGIIFDLVTDGKTRDLVIKNQPTLNQEESFVSTDGQDTFTVTKGHFQLGRNGIEIYIDGIRQSYANFQEVNDQTVQLFGKLTAGRNVLITWKEGAPEYAIQSAVSIADIAVATRNNDGLMPRQAYIDLYSHTHSLNNLTDVNVFTGVSLDDGTNVQLIQAQGQSTLKLKSGDGIKFDRINDLIKITAVGPTISAGNGISVSGDVLSGYKIATTLFLHADEGISITQDENTYIFKGPKLVSGKGVSIVTTNPNEYTFTNTMSLSEGGGIQVTGDAENGFQIINSMSLQVASESSITVQGDAEQGYVLTGFWPTIVGGIGAAVDDAGNGHFTVRNMGVVSYNGQTGDVTGVVDINTIQQGNGIKAWHDENNHWVIENEGVVSLVAGLGMSVTDETNGVWEIVNTGVVSLTAGTGIQVTQSGGVGNWVVKNTGITSAIGEQGIDVTVNTNGQAAIKNTGVTSFNGDTGDVQYDAPVKSVNGETGYVTLNIPPQITKMVGSPHQPPAIDRSCFLPSNSSTWVHCPDGGLGMCNYIYFVKIPGSTRATIRIDGGTVDGNGYAEVQAQASIPGGAQFTTATAQITGVGTNSVPDYPNTLFHLDISGLPDNTVFGVSIILSPTGGEGMAKLKYAYVE